MNKILEAKIEEEIGISQDYSDYNNAPIVEKISWVAANMLQRIERRLSKKIHENI